MTQSQEIRTPIKYTSIVQVQINKSDDGSKSNSLNIIRDIKKGESILSLVGEDFIISPNEIFSVPNFRTVQVRDDVHILLDSEFEYMNHSCNPSVKIVITDSLSDDKKSGFIKIDYIALKDLHKNDELAFFYPSTEWAMDEPFNCWCGDSKCCKEIKGAKYLKFQNDQLESIIANWGFSDFIVKKLKTLKSIN